MRIFSLTSKDQFRIVQTIYFRLDLYTGLLGFPWFAWLFEPARWADALGFPWLAWLLALAREAPPLPDVS